MAALPAREAAVTPESQERGCFVFRRQWFGAFFVHAQDTVLKYSVFVSLSYGLRVILSDVDVLLGLFMSNWRIAWSHCMPRPASNLMKVLLCQATSRC